MAVSTSSLSTSGRRCILAWASAIRMMLSRWRTAMGIPWLMADSLRSSVYTCKSGSHVLRPATAAGAGNPGGTCCVSWLFLTAVVQDLKDDKSALQSIDAHNQLKGNQASRTRGLVSRALQHRPRQTGWGSGAGGWRNTGC